MYMLLASVVFVSVAASQPLTNEGVDDWEKLGSSATVPPATREVKCDLSPVQALTVLGALTDTVAIRWLSPRDSDDVRVEYAVRWQIVEGGCARHDCVSSGEKAVRRTSVSLEGLQPFTRVCFTVIPYIFQGDARCYGKQSVLCARSLPDDRTIRVTGLNSSSLAISWKQQHGEEAYLVHVCTRRGSCSQLEFNANGACRLERVLGGSTRFSVSGLEPWTSVLVKVTPYDTSGVQCFTTEVGRPTPPQELKATVTDTSATIFWKPPAVPNGPVDSYDVTVTEVGNVSRTVHSEEVDSVRTNTTVEKLSPGSVYVVKVQGINYDSRKLDMVGEPTTLTIETLPRETETPSPMTTPQTTTEATTTPVTTTEMTTAPATTTPAVTVTKTTTEVTTPATTTQATTTPVTTTEMTTAPATTTPAVTVTETTTEVTTPATTSPAVTQSVTPPGIVYPSERPLPPRSLKVETTSTSMHASWADSESFLAGPRGAYTVRIEEGYDPKEMEPHTFYIGETEFDFAGLKPSTYYAIYVQAYWMKNGTMWESEYAGTLFLTLPEPTM